MKSSLRSFIVAALVLSTMALGWVRPLQASDPPPSYSKDVYPILRANCFACHQQAKNLGNYVMTDFGAMLRGGETQHTAIVPGKSSESYLIEEILPKDGHAEMPKNGKPLSEAEIDILRRWIDAGAVNDWVDKGPEFSPNNPPKYAQSPSIGSLDFTPDGSLLAVGGYHEVLLLDTQRWELQHRLVGLSPRIESLRFSPDQKWLAVAAGQQGVSGELQVWDVANKKLHRSQLLGSDTLFGINWSPEAALISFGMADNTIRAVDMEGNQKLYQRAHEDWPRATVFTIDGKHLISVARDMTVKLIEVETERFIDNITSITPGALRGGVQALARNPHRNEIVVGGADGTPKIYRVFRQTARVIGDDANLLHQLEAMPGRVFGVAVSPDAKFIAAAATVDNQSVVQVWSYDAQAELPENIRTIQNKSIAERSADELKTLNAFTPAKPKLIHKWTVPDAAVYSVALDAQGRVACGASDGHVRVWSCLDGQLLIDRDITPADSRITASQSSIAELRNSRLDALRRTHQAERTAAAPSTIPIDKITAIQVQPAAIELNAWNDSVQLIVSAMLDTGDIVDATSIAQFTSEAKSEGNSIWLSDRGWVQPLASGNSVIQVRSGIARTPGTDHGPTRSNSAHRLCTRCKSGPIAIGLQRGNLPRRPSWQERLQTFAPRLRSAL